jgi:hypothetical protein
VKRTTIYLIISVLFIAIEPAKAQDAPPKFSVNGAARSIFFLDDLQQDLAEPDTVTGPKQNSAHAMVDVGINVRPADYLEVQGMVRIRNDFGGFWGAGVTFDVRQLYVKGVIKDIVRYQVGDINYQLTPYTFYNNDQELYSTAPVLFSHLSDAVNYDNFFNVGNSWRQQGAAVDFGLSFNSLIESVDFNLFTSRVLPSNAATVSDRLFSTFNMQVVQSEFVTLGFNYANLYDLAGTSRNDILLNNPVITGTANVNYKVGSISLRGELETGTSTTTYLEDTDAPEWNDGFFDGRIHATYDPVNVTVTAGFKSVGPEFRSPGAQTKRINFGALPAAFDRITNDQVLRPLTMLDIVRETSLFNLQLQNGLMVYDPRYDNITPYGAATPNRQGFHVGLAYVIPGEWIELGATMHALTEVRGQGTTNLREYNRMEAEAVIHAGDKFFANERLLDISFNTRSDATSRAAEIEGIPVVDMSTQVLGVGIEAEIISQLDIVMGFQSHTYSGFEFSNVTDNYGQVINFQELEVDGSQQMLGAGLRFRFSDKTYLTGQWSSFSTTDSLNEVLPDYDINTISMIFSMYF